MEIILTMIWVDDALQQWMVNHLVEVPQTMIPTTRRYSANTGEWPLRYEVTNPEPSITAKLQPYLESRATLD